MTTINSLNKEVDETKELLHKSINKVLERNDNLQDIESKSDNLRINSRLFRNKSRNLKIRQWLCDNSISIIFSFLIIVFIIMIIVIISTRNSSSDDDDYNDDDDDYNNNSLT